MIVEAYEPYHIGIKLDLNVNAVSLRDKLKKLLKKEKYEVEKEFAVQQQISIEPASEILGVLNGIRIELNFVAQAVNIIGDDPERVFEQFEKIVKLFSDIGYDTNIAIAFYEIMANIIVKSEKNPVELLASAVKLNIDKQFIDRGVNVTGIKISNKLRPEMRDVFTDMSIQPSPVSPSNRFFIQFVYRSKSKDDIKIFRAKLEEVVLKSLNSLGTVP